MPVHDLASRSSRHPTELVLCQGGGPNRSGCGREACDAQEAPAVSGAGVGGLLLSLRCPGRSMVWVALQRHGEVPPAVPVLHHLGPRPGEQPAVREVGQEGVHLVWGQAHGDLCTATRCRAGVRGGVRDRPDSRQAVSKLVDDAMFC